MFSRRPNERFNRGRIPSGAAAFSPNDITGIKAWWAPSLGITLLGTLLQTTGAGPVITISGTLAQSAAIKITIDGTGDVGVGTFAWSLDGATQESGVTIASTYDLGSTGVTAAFPAGTYNSGDVYDAVVTTMADQATNGSVADDLDAPAGEEPLMLSSNASYSIQLLGSGDTMQTAVDSVDLHGTDDAEQTWACWIKWNGAAEYFWSQNLTPDRFQFTVVAGGKVHADIWNAEVGLPAAAVAETPASSITASTWHWVVLQFDGAGATDADKFKIWIDGSAQSLTFSGEVMPDALNEPNDPMHYGSRDGAVTWNGELGPAYLSQGLLTTDEMDSLQTYIDPS